MPMQPPLGGKAPPLQCNRLTGGTFDEPDYCGKPATWHIIWTVDAENGLACEAHADEARAKWAYFGLHPYEMVCSMPGALYDPERDRCYIDEETLGLRAEETVSVGAGETVTPEKGGS